MATYTEHEQRQLDAASGAEMDKRASTEVARAGFAQHTELAARSAQGEAAQMLNQVMAVILDPNVPESRLDRLLVMHERLVADQRRMMFVEALARAQATFPIIEEKGTIKVFSKALREQADREGAQVLEGKSPQQQTPYALWEDVVAGITPSLTREGLTLAFDVDTIPTGDSFVIVIKGLLRHTGGHTETVKTPPLKHDSTGSKNAIQAVKSTISYGKVMAAGLLTNFASRGENNDGQDGAPINGGESGDIISDEQYRYLQKEITEQGGKCLADVLNAFGPRDKVPLPSLADLPASRYDECVLRLAERKKRLEVAAKNKGFGAA